MFFRALVIGLLGSLVLLHVDSGIRHERQAAGLAALRVAPPPPRAHLASPPAHPLRIHHTWATVETIVVDIRRSELDRMLTSPELMTGARLVPSLRNGVSDGFKIYAIAPGSLFEALGFRNGDTLRAINDLPVTDAQALLDATPTDARPEFYDVSVRRASEQLRIVVLVHG